MTNILSTLPFVTRKNGNWIGAMRLVLAGNGRMPSEGMCNLAPVPEKSSQRCQMVEFSRLCIVESYLRYDRDRNLVSIIDGKPGEASKTVPHPKFRLALFALSEGAAFINDRTKLLGQVYGR